jgi:TRAP-type C4-dicarboxylate transport system permease small subunit
MHDPFVANTGEREPLPRAVSVERWVLALVMGLLCVITMANVLVRYFTNVSFAFTEEISVWLLVVMTLLGTATAFHRNNHIAIVFVIDRCAPKTRDRFALFGYAASALMFGLLAWYGTRMAWDDFRFEVTSPALGAPQWFYSAWLPLLSLLVVARLLVLIRRRSGRAARTGKPLE